MNATRYRFARHAQAWLPLLPVATVYLVVTLWIALAYPFPSMFDELAHLSVARAQYEHLDLFADTRQYKMLDADNLGRWSAQSNFLNHPPLFYMGLAPWFQLDDPARAMRLVNVALSVAGLVVVIAAGCRIFRTVFEGATFAIIAASFPKAALIGGMINNDNLAAVAAASVFAGMAGAPVWLVAAGLALAGWTKLTALIALAAAVGVKALLDRKQGILNRANLLALAGVAIGSMPYLVTVSQSGQLFHVNVDVYASTPGTRPAWDFLDYTRMFFSELVGKWPAAEASLPLWIGCILVAVPLVFAMIGTRHDHRVCSIGVAYLAATFITLLLHFAFGWHSFQTIGDLTIAQTRYYNVLWPGLALAGAAAVSRLGRATPIALGLYLAPTVLCGAVLALF